MKEPHQSAEETAYGVHHRPAPHSGSIGPGPGVTRIQGALASGTLTVEGAASIVSLHPGEYDEIMALLQEERGNLFAYEVQQMAGEPRRGSGVPEDKLIAWDPVVERGEEGQAAWLLEAVSQGFATAHGETKTQLRALKKGKKKIESVEAIPAEGKDHNVKPKRKAGKDHKGRELGVYDVKVDDAPILSVLVHLLRGHIEKFHRSREILPEPLFELGTFLRRDHGFGDGSGSDHTKGAAIDLGGMEFSSDDDVIEILEALPPKAFGAVVPDNSSHLHVGVRDGAYRIGLGFEGDFFPTSLKQAEAKKNAVKGKKPGDEPRAEWVELYETEVFTAKASWNEGAQRWEWKRKTVKHGAKAFDKLKSKRVKDALLALNPANVSESTEAEVESSED